MVAMICAITGLRIFASDLKLQRVENGRMLIVLTIVSGLSKRQRWILVCWEDLSQSQI